MESKKSLGEIANAEFYYRYDDNTEGWAERRLDRVASAVEREVLRRQAERQMPPVEDRHLIDDADIPRPFTQGVHWHPGPMDFIPRNESTPQERRRLAIHAGAVVLMRNRQWSLHDATSESRLAMEEVERKEKLTDDH